MKNKSYLSDSSYKVLKAIVTLVLPAFGVFYVAIAAIWNFGGGEQVSATVLAVVTFLGVILNVSSGRYSEDTTGNLILSTDPNGSPKLAFQMDHAPETFAKMASKVNQVHFNVIKAPTDGFLADVSNTPKDDTPDN